MAQTEEEKKKRRKEAVLKYNSSEKGKQKRREYMRKYNSTDTGKEYNRKHSKEWRKKNKIPHSKNRINTGTSIRNAVIDFLLKRDGYYCGICTKPLDTNTLHINHIVPSAIGGPDTLENFNLTHPACNMAQANDIRKQVKGY